MAVFYVVKKGTCENCRGDGVVDNDVWVQYWKDNPGGLKSISDDAEYFWERHHIYVTGSENLPAEEVTCPVCNGQGTTLENVDLRHALVQLLTADEGGE